MAMSPGPARGNALSAPAGQNSVLSGNGLAVASMLTWAAGFPAAEVLLQTWPPVALLVARMAMAVAFLLPIWVMIDGPERVLRARWGHAFVVGGFGIGLGMFLLIVAQKLTDPVTTAIIASCAPLIATLLELASGTRRLKWNFAVGVLISVVGGLIATSAVAPAQLGLGAACAVAATALFCWGSQATSRDFPELSQTGRAAVTFVGGFFMATILMAGAHHLGMDIVPSISIDTRQIGMLAIYSLISMALSQILFVASIGQLGVALTSFHINVAPFYVMLIMLVLGEEWNWTRALGAGVVAMAVVLAQDRRVAKPA
ncbi:DMT family transporter [Ruegeria atlantica]|uniref:DMT family transporter n=1 Tax=Ruegeria atlantica TaxID=81569 RepID=UPI00249402A1|nr:DMT family transporter [Ruegeria atlantica]